MALLTKYQVTRCEKNFPQLKNMIFGTKRFKRYLDLKSI